MSVIISSVGERLTFLFSAMGTGAKKKYVEKSLIKHVDFEYDGVGTITYVSFVLSESERGPASVMRFNVADVTSPVIVTENDVIVGLDITASGSSGGIYNAVAPVLVAGEQAPLQLDVNGNLLSLIKGIYNLVEPVMVNGASGALQLNSAGYLKTMLSDAVVSALLKVGITIPATHFSPQDFSAVYLSACELTTVSFNGLPVIDSGTMSVVSIMVYTFGNTGKKYINGQDGVLITASAGILKVWENGVASTTAFTTGGTADTKYRVAVSYRKVGDDPATDTVKNTVENYPLQPVVSTLVTLVNDSTAGAYYPSADGLDMGPYTKFTDQWVTTAAGQLVHNLEATLVESPAAADWVSIHLMGVDLVTGISGVATTTNIHGTNNVAMLDFEGLNVKAVRVVASGTAADGTITCRRSL